MKDRIRFIRKEANLIQESFGSRIGLTRRGVQELENGNSGVSEGTRRLICSEFHINRKWLETGEGEMHTDFSDDMMIETMLDGESPFIVNTVKKFFAAWQTLSAEQKESVEDALKTMLEAYKKESE